MSTPTPKPVGDVWKLAAGGTAAIALAALIAVAAGLDRPAQLVAVRVLLILGGALAIGVALYLRPGHVSLYCLACGAAAVARFGMPPEWDSFRILAGFASLVAGAGAVLTALPAGYRKAAASALMLLHFGGILVAVTSPGSPPWLTNAVGVLVYRPYLQCAYLTNAYHFYSPEPGPASQVWFCIKYQPDEKGTASARWFKFPRRPDDMTDPLALSYYRRLSLTMRLESVIPFNVTDDRIRARTLAAQGQDGIPFHPEYMPLGNQFRLPDDTVRDFILPSYVRHVARRKDWQHDDGKTKIAGIKVYRVEHRILQPYLIQQGLRPYDPDTYLPYYLGEFDPDGNHLDPGDPLLYWMVPIMYVPNPAKGEIPPWHTWKTHPDEFILIDGVKRHAGVDHSVSK